MASRHFHYSYTEWSLFSPVYNELMAKWGEPDKDMFASRLTHKVPQYVSWKPDPGAIVIDAFTPDRSRFKGTVSQTAHVQVINQKWSNVFKFVICETKWHQQAENNPHSHGGRRNNSAASSFFNSGSGRKQEWEKSRRI